MRRRRLAPALACLALAACDDPMLAGGTTVALSWSFGEPDAGCAAAGVETVHVFVGPLAPAGFYDQELRCEAGERGVLLRGVAPGRHVLVIKGIAGDKVLYTTTEEVDVTGDIGHVVLAPYAPP